MVVLFWSRKLLEGVHPHVMDLFRKKFEFPILVQISISNRNWTKIGNWNFWKVDQNRICIRDSLSLIENFEEKLNGPKSNFRKSITWWWTPSDTFLDQTREPPRDKYYSMDASLFMIIINELGAVASEFLDPCYLFKITPYFRRTPCGEWKLT